MSERSRHVTVVSMALSCLVLWPQPHAFALELMKDLPCALMETVQKDGSFCLKVFNTCNTPLISRIKEKDGYDKDSPEMLSGERGEVCSAAPFAFVGHYVSSGP